MSRISKCFGLLLIVSVFCLTSGCAYFTARKVATMAGKHVAKDVVKKGMEDSKEDKAKKEQAKREQARRDRARKQEAQRAQLQKSQNQKKQSTSRPASR